MCEKQISIGQARHPL